MIAQEAMDNVAICIYVKKRHFFCLFFCSLYIIYLFNVATSLVNLDVHVAAKTFGHGLPDSLYLMQ